LKFRNRYREFEFTSLAIESFSVFGATQGHAAAINLGVNPGELVVVNGAEKLRRGSSVSVQLAANPITP
jgi:hypothetical protein